MSKPLAVIKHWTGATIKIDVATPELGIGTLDIQHDDGLFRVSVSLDEKDFGSCATGSIKRLSRLGHTKKGIK